MSSSSRLSLLVAVATLLGAACGGSDQTGLQVGQSDGGPDLSRTPDSARQTDSGALLAPDGPQTDRNGPDEGAATTYDTRAPAPDLPLTIEPSTDSGSAAVPADTGLPGNTTETGALVDVGSTTPPATGQSVVPSSPVVASGATISFNLVQVDAGVSGVTWAASAGTIDATTGAWTAPSVTATTQVTITAKSSSGGATLGTTMVTIQPSVEITAISPANPNVVSGVTTVFDAKVSNALDLSISWSATGGTINPTTGVWTAPVVTALTTVTITATANADATRHSSTVATIAAAPNTYVTGEQHIAVLLVSFPSVHLLSSATSDMYRKTYFGSAPSVDSFLRESSYGQVSATGEVFGPFVLDADYFDQPEAARDAALRAAAGTVDLTKFNRLVLVVPQSSAGLESGGRGTIGSELVNLYPTGSMTISTSWLGDASAGSDSERLNAACHELGHNFGLEHARAIDFGQEALGPLGQLPAPWDQSLDYGDNFSNMARGLGHWAAPQKSALGWLRDGTDIQTVEGSGSFVLSSYEAAGNTLKALRISRGTGNNAWLWVEARQPAAGSIDGNLPATASAAALVHYEEADWNDTQIHSNLVRMKPDSPGGLAFGNAPLPAGSTWTDPYSNLTLSLGSDTTQGLSVSVSYAAAPANPSALTPVSSTVAAAGGNLTIAITAASDFAWTASTSASWLQISSNTTGAGSGQITVAVSPSTITGKRWGKILVGQASALVVQEGLAGDLSITPTSASAPATGTTGQIAVVTNSQDYSWTFTVNDTWIQGVDFSKRDWVGSGTLRYLVAANTSTQARTGTITIGGTKFTITQAAGDASVSQLEWQQITLSDAPMSRLDMGMAGFMQNGEAILYGGSADGTAFTDTWAWNGSSWLLKSPAHNPGGRGEHGMVYDAYHNQIVLFGGFHESQLTSETWIWDGTDWQMKQTNTKPAGRVNAAMAYDPVNKQVVLFGGGSTSELATWLWDGTDWTKKDTSNGPVPRDGATMAYDEARHEMVLFGGAQDLWSGNMPTLFNDTWIWNGTEWKVRPTSNSPTGRTGSTMQYDPQLGQIVLVGGYGVYDVTESAPPYSISYAYREETWTWDGTYWTQRFPASYMPFSYTYGMVYDATQKRFTTHLGDDLHCADRGPKAFALNPGTGAVTLDSYRAELPASGGSGSVKVTGSVSWQAASDAWITLNSPSSGTTSGTLSFQVSANSSSTPRVGQITVKDKRFVISQAGAQ